MSDKLILGIQVGGFAAALVALFSTSLHVVFVIALGIHFVGDLMRLKKDGLL
jgi:hypothetical protein